MLEQAQQLMDALEVNKNDGNFEIAVDVIKKYGSYRKAMQASIKIEFKKKEAMLIALLGTEDDKNYNENIAEANRLIKLVYGMNDKVFNESVKSGRTFDDELTGTNFTNISDADREILNKVRCFDGKRNGRYLIANIGMFKNGSMQTEAFVNALKFSYKDENLIENKSMNILRIKR